MCIRLRTCPILSLDLEDGLANGALADTWLMTILWPEDGKLTWLASNERLCLHTRILGDILSLVVLYLRKVLQRSISVGFLVIKWNLNINHLAMSLDNGILLFLTLSLSDIQEKVCALNRICLLYTSDAADE